LNNFSIIKSNHIQITKEIKQIKQIKMSIFSFVKNSMTAMMLEDAHGAITKAGAWDYMKTDPGEGGYMFTRNETLDAINVHIDTDNCIGHSGSSYGWTMRQMQYIAINGLEEYEKRYKKNNP